MSSGTSEGAQVGTKRPVTAYFSHSYRPEDRHVNMEVWKHLNALGVVFAVDPPDRKDRPRPMDITFLERMMQQSDCFIAIVPDRARGQADPRDGAGGHVSWSTYQALEYRLAVRANKPCLLIVEQGIDRGPVSDGAALWFTRDGPTFPPNFSRLLEDFVHDMRAPRSGFARRIGILRWNPPHPVWTTLTESVRATLDERCEVLEVNGRSPDHSILARAREMDVVIVDLNPDVTPPYLFGMLHGAAVPLFRTCLVEPGADTSQLTANLGLSAPAIPPTPIQPGRQQIPRLLHGYQLDAGMHPVLFWTTDSIARDASTIAQVTAGYAQRDRTLRVEKSARDYFLSLRGNRVFISTPGDLNELTQKVKHALDNAGMPAFHYKESPLKGGQDWERQITSDLSERDLLLGFISPTYWDRRECVEELSAAVERWERHDMQIVLYASEPFPPLPPFLAQSQVNRIRTAEDTAERIVAELHSRFEESLQESLESAARPLLAPMRRHLDLADESEALSILIDTCGMPASEADDLSKKVAAAPDPADELLTRLLSELGAGRYGGPALGRLCYWLRSHETSPHVREELSALPATLRLFSGLHNVRAWNRRRVRPDVTIRLKADAPKRLLAYSAQDPQDSAALLEKVRVLGQELMTYIDVADSKASAAILGSRDARVCVEGSADQLSIPVEWAILPGMDAPLSRARPLIRRIVGQTSRPRASLEQRFDAGLTGPPRVLLFGEMSTLINVEHELDSIQRIFADRYKASGWPEELIDRVPAKGGPAGEATYDTLKSKLQGSDYDVVHLAGHAGFDGEDAVFQVLDDEGGEQHIRGEELAAWLRTSMVRFVYLSCCEGATEGWDIGRITQWRRSLCKELIDAGVAEIVAYAWEISDEGSVAFTKAFYDAYVREFDAAVAIQEARRAAERGDALWASSVLVEVT